VTTGWTAYRASDVQATVAKELEHGAPDRLLRKAAGGLAVVCADALQARFGTVYGRRIAMLVGTGNNGADALLAGIRLRRRGVVVDALLVGDRAYEPGVRRLAAAGGRAVSTRTQARSTAHMCARTSP
jgi:NAD(P)H-hydrate repair Nnr-like enzyme with NAD(P)H-hydrate epimerase domain